MQRDEYRDQIVTMSVGKQCDMGLPLHSKIHPLYSIGYKHKSMSQLVSSSISTIPICLFNVQNFLVAALFIFAFSKLLHERLYVS